jgi:hypothetical protein
MRRWLLLCISLSLTLILTEGLLRISPRFRPVHRTYVGDYPSRPSEIWVADPMLGWRLRPHIDNIPSNGQGFRSPRDFDADAPCRHIAIAGDSFAYGWHVSYEQTFAAIIEAKLPDTCVNNYALPGYGLDQMWLAVRTEALPRHPHFVIVAFIVDDFSRSTEAYRRFEGRNKPRFILRHGALVPETLADHPNFLLRFVQHNSSLWWMGRLAARSLGYYYPYGEWWTLNAAILDRIREDCRSAGVPLLFVYIHMLGDRPFPMLQSYMKANSANFIELSLSTDKYIPKDLHLNEKGHAQVAEALLRLLPSACITKICDPPDSTKKNRATGDADTRPGRCYAVRGEGVGTGPNLTILFRVPTFS